MFGIGEAIGKLAAAPLRILDIPNRMLSAAVGEKPPPVLEEMAQAVEDQTKRIIGD